ncbi:MAG: hypothetical protein HRU15_13235 [Planctomycetes bacterium]|nr:hypothetical protein [Planctomycetota bacterium]
MRLHTLITIFTLCCSLSQLYAQGANLFGEKNINLDAQKTEYFEIFASLENEATSEKDKMRLDIGLDEYLTDADYKHIEDYLCIRILELMGRNKSPDALRIRVNIFDKQHDLKNLSFEDSLTLFGKLEAFVAKAPAREQKQLYKRMAYLQNNIFMTARDDNNIRQLSTSQRALEKIYKKTGDKKSHTHIRKYYDAIKQRSSHESKFSKLKDNAVDGNLKDINRYLWYSFESNRAEEAMTAAQQLQDSFQLPEALHICTIYEQLTYNANIPPSDASSCSAAILKHIQNNTCSLFLECKLASIGLALAPIAQTDSESSRSQKLRLKQAAQKWESRLQELPLLAEYFDNSASALSANTPMQTASFSLGEQDRFDLMLPISFFYGAQGKMYQTKLHAHKKSKVQLVNTVTNGVTIWWGENSGPAPIHADCKTGILLVGHLGVAAHGDLLLKNAHAELDKLVQQFATNNVQLILMTTAVMPEIQTMKIDENGLRFNNGIAFQKLISAYAQEKNIPLVDVFTPSVQRWKEDPSITYFSDKYAGKITAAHQDLMIECISQILQPK